jgi:tellurite methyltransferase
MTDPGVGGYDDGYAACPFFWGLEPGSYVKDLVRIIPSFEGRHVLDIGCGDGKNSRFLANLGADVEAIDISEIAIKNALNNSPTDLKIHWSVGDIRTLRLRRTSYDIVIMYGILHCLRNEREIREIIKIAKEKTNKDGYHVVCAFNNRLQELSAHPGFSPTLLPHQLYLDLYTEWNLVKNSDQDLFETHPHNNIPHTHSLTRIIAKK